jgi:ribosome-associated protein
MSSEPSKPAAWLVPEHELEFLPIRAQGPGGQNVNKVSCAIHLRFDIGASSLPGPVKERLLALSDQRINKDGVLVIKAQTARSLEQNKADALARLTSLVQRAAEVPRVRRPTRPTRASKQRRLQAKTVRGDVKALRAKVVD